MSNKVKVKTLEEREAEMIKVNDEYLIDIDPYSYIARRKGINSPLAYSGNIQNALSCIYDDMCRRKLIKEARCLIDVTRIIKECKDELIAACKVNFPGYEVIKK